MKWRPRRSWATVSLLAGLSLAPAAASAAGTPSVVSLRDPRITEASALVDLGSMWVTSNDSGDNARLFVISPVTGRTIGIVRLRATVQDVEALAPAGVSAVWVGDIGDNAGKRRSISVYRVTVGPGLIDVTPRPIRLVYPRGRPNAESMFVDGEGRLNVITKTIAGGVVYRAPARLSGTRPNRLQAVGRVAEYATDAARSRDGRHLIVRGPEIAGVYTLPGLQRLGAVRLPRQRQGEAISVGPSGKIRIGSEGAHSAVREIVLPPALLRVFDPALAPPPSPTASPSPSPSPSPSSTPSPSPSPATAPTTDSSSGGIGPIDPPWLMWGIPAVIGIGALGIGLGLRRRAE